MRFRLLNDRRAERKPGIQIFFLFKNKNYSACQQSSRRLCQDDIFERVEVGERGRAVRHTGPVTLLARTPTRAPFSSPEGRPHQQAPNRDSMITHCRAGTEIGPCAGTPQSFISAVRDFQNELDVLYTTIDDLLRLTYYSPVGALTLVVIQHVCLQLQYMYFTCKAPCHIQGVIGGVCRL